LCSKFEPPKIGTNPPPNPTFNYHHAMSNFLKNVGQPLVYRVIHPLIVGLAKAGVTPNMITTVGFLLNVVVAIIFIRGAGQPRMELEYVGWGGAMILFAGLFDMIDGRLARVSGTSSRFGALYDSVLDRYSELFMFLGICYYLAAHHYFYSSVFAFLAMIGSIMVSYVRARAEGLGIECSDGLMQRPERILTIGVSAVLCGVVSHWFGAFRYAMEGWSVPFFENITIFTFPIFLLALLANYTAVQRLEHCRRELEKIN
jgi:CDP-diacylglycerol---glycerol-3-phosphate 3-phosphatidyltransferase